MCDEDPDELPKPVKSDEVRRAEWGELIRLTIGIPVPLSKSWTTDFEIAETLSFFMGPLVNETRLPTGGWYHMLSVVLSPEPGCLDLSPETDVAFIVRPKELVLEHFPESPWNSFFLLELAPLEPTGLYVDNSWGREELMELRPNHYVTTEGLHRGFMGTTADGDPIPLPSKFRRVSRFFSGKFLIVGATSYWNRLTHATAGDHDNMTHEQIRAAIQKAIDKFGA